MKRAAIIFILAVVLGSAAGAQRASRPADDWIATLEAPEREVTGPSVRTILHFERRAG